MRMIDELFVRGEPAAMTEFKARLETATGDTWGREAISGDLLVPIIPFYLRPRIRFRSRGVPGRRIVLAWLREEGPRECRLGGMMAEDRRPMDDDEYNEALGSFLEFLEDSTAGLAVEVVRIPFRVKMEEIVSSEAMRRLEAFVEQAAKTSLSPFDRARWRSFVTQVHRDGSALYPEELDLWLEMNGWPEEMRRNLVEVYDVGLCLLKEYDEEHVG